MKKVLLFVVASLAVTGAFADMSKSLGAAWKNQPTVQPKQDPRDITIVYGGEDLSRKPLDPHMITL